MSTIEIQKNGVGSLGFMFFILFLLKVGVVETQVMSWSWWWIFAPMWVLPVFIGIIFGSAFAFYMIFALITKWKKSRE